MAVRSAYVNPKRGNSKNARIKREISKFLRREIDSKEHPEKDKRELRRKLRREAK